MAISTTGSQVLYTGTNSPNQICPFPYIFFANTDLEVVTLDASNVSRTLILGTDYSVTGANNNSGGSVTLFLAVPTTTRISIVRNNPETQLVSLTTGDRFPASIMERALDKLTMLVQELSRAVSKSLRFSDVSAPQPDLLPLPASVLTTDTSSTLQFSSTSSATGDAPFFLAATTRGGQPTFQSIPSGAVGTTQIATGAVGTSQLADSSVTSAKIADSFVTTNTRQTITAEKVIQVLYETTSNTSISSSVGNKSFVVGTGLNWVAGDQIQLLVRNTALQWMRGSVLSYNTSTGAMTASITNNNIGGFGQSYNDWVVTHWAGGVPALRITSTDTAPAFLVEDSTNPDTTPFTISSTGRVGIGVTPDASVCLSLDTTGVKFGDGTIQTTAGGGGGGGVTSVAGTAPISSSGGTTPTISIATASSTTTGALSSTDWNTFNNKGAGTITSVTGTSPIASSGGATPVISIANAAADGVTKGAATFNASDFNATAGVVSIDYTNGQAASATATGFLTSTDWNTFNNKGGGITSVTGTSPIASSGGATPVISIAAASTTGSGAVQLTDSTNSTSITTAATPNSVKTAFDLASGKVTSVAGTAPISSSGGTTPTISIATASSTTTGALSSTDWNTFNNKGAGTITSVTGTSPIASSGGATPVISIAAASTTGSGAVQLTDSTNSTSITTAATPNSVKTAFDLASGKVTSVAGTAPISSSGGTTPTISIATASSTTTGALSSTDWNTFNNKGAGTITSVTGTSPIASSGGATPVISIAAASTTGSGAVQLTDSTNSTSITTAATPNSVKTAFDLASGKVSKTGDTMTGSLVVAVNSNTPALNITQTGLGEALRVEDNTTPDSTAFVVSTTGRVGIGNVPDSTAALHVDSGGIKFNDGTIQTTASTGGNPNLVTTDTRQTITGEKVIQSLYESTSTSPILLGTGTKTLTIGTGLNWVAGRNVRVRSTTGISYMNGEVLSYDSVTGIMVFNAITRSGTGTLSSWNISQQDSTAVPALRITSADAAPAFLVEDSTNPDTTPFTISSTGKTGIGTAPDSTAALSVDSGGIKFGNGTIQTTAYGSGAYFEAYDHFITGAGIGLLGLTYLGTNGGSATQVTTNPAVFGALRIATANNSTANTGARINGSGTINLFNPTGVGEVRFMSRIRQFSTDFFSPTCRGVFRTGFGDSINATPANGIFFSVQESNQVSFLTYANGVGSQVMTDVFIEKDVWNIFEFIISPDGTRVVAKINNLEAATQTTNIPNAYMFPITNLSKYQADPGLVQMDVDYIYLSIKQ